MKFLRVSAAAVLFVVLSGQDGTTSGCSGGAAPCTASVQEMTFGGYAAGCQVIEFCDPERGRPTSLKAMSDYSHYFVSTSPVADTTEAEEKRLYLADWLYFKPEGTKSELCVTTPVQAVAGQGASSEPQQTLLLELRHRTDGDVTKHTINAKVVTIDLQPAVTNADRTERVAGEPVAVFVGAVDELKIKPNLSRRTSDSAATILYKLNGESMPVPGVPLDAEATLDVSPRIDAGQSATVNVTLMAETATISRDLTVRVVERADDPILDIRPTADTDCAGMACAPDGTGTHFSMQCMTRSHSVPGAVPIDWGQFTVSDVSSDDARVVTRASDSFLLCYTPGRGVIEVVASALRAGDDSRIEYRYPYDTSSRR